MYNEQNNLLNAKQAMDQKQFRTMGMAGQALDQDCCEATQPYRPPTLREQAEKNAAHHSEQAQKHSTAAAFLSEYPQFDQFIQLVRSGAIQF